MLSRGLEEHFAGVVGCAALAVTLPLEAVFRGLTLLVSHLWSGPCNIERT